LEHHPKVWKAPDFVFEIEAPKTGHIRSKERLDPTIAAYVEIASANRDRLSVIVTLQKRR